jgi:hypothetical protein
MPAAIGISTIAWTMSSETSTDQLQPWQLFTLVGLAGATAVVFVTRGGGPAGIILLSLTVGAAAWAGHAAWRALAPLAGLYHPAGGAMLGGRTRGALERDKALVLRAIKDLEFDRAMGKVSEADFEELVPRLRTRAMRLIRELDHTGGYRDEIEKEIARRLGAPAPGPMLAANGLRCACGTTNDVDARFCKACGQRIEAA